MIELSLHPEGTSVEVDPDTVIRLGKVSEHSEDGDPSFLVTTVGTLVVGESIRTISARFGDTIGLSDYADATTERAAAFSLAWVAGLTKPYEDSSSGDPTMVHLANGEDILVDASIRTLSARLKLGAGIETVDVDVLGTERPAAVVPGQVKSVLRTAGPGGEEGDGRSVVVLAGGTSLACRDEPGSLKRVIAAALPVTAPDETVSPAP